jgi:GT2 family glycosyltransferase
MSAQAPVTGILVVNYHFPEETAACVASLLALEPATSRILWIENDAAQTREALLACLATVAFPWVEVDPEQGPMPPSGTVGVILCPDNLGYAGGNNVGLRFLHRHGVPFGWVLNNDTLLVAGNSDLLAEASRARPGVGAWGTTILTDFLPVYFGGIVQTRDFAIRHARTPEALGDPLAFVSGCSLFLPMAIAAEVGFLPEDYFLYYEDPSYSLALRKAGYEIDALWTVTVRHLESLSTGRRSPLMEFYNRRNRWFFIERFFPEHLARQKRRFWYSVQKYLLRFKFTSLKVEWVAFEDYHHARLGKTSRVFSGRRR